MWDEKVRFEIEYHRVFNPGFYQSESTMMKNILKY